MKHHYSAIQLNDCGICSLLHHNYEEATGFFHDALIASKDDLRRQELEQKSKMISCSASAQEDMLYKSIGIESYGPLRSTGFFHQDPTRICKMTYAVVSCKENHGSRTSKNFVCAVIFNLAITTHLWALQSGSTEQLQKALRLYHNVCRTTRLGDDDVAAAGPNTISVVTTTLNNMASIHVAMSNHELAATFLQQLLAIVMYCSWCTPEEQGWKICWENALTQLVGPPSTAGAA